MKISVIIAVYNDERFVEKAVLSVLNQDETGEVIIVDDGSTDDSINICKKLATKFKKIKIYYHSNKKNHGRGATKNLGILKSQCDYIAFCDADDFYLRGRFSEAKKLFNKYKDIDGVYEAIGTHAYDKKSLESHLKRMKKAKKDHSNLLLTTMDEEISPEVLFDKLLLRKKGWFHWNGLTLKRKAIKKAGLIENYNWCEDQEWFFRLSYYLTLIPGRLKEPVAMRGIYIGNKTLSAESMDDIVFYHTKMWEKIFLFMLNNKLNKRINRYILMRKLDYCNTNFANMEVGLKRKIIKGINLLKIMMHYPQCIFKII